MKFLIVSVGGCVIKEELPLPMVMQGSRNYENMPLYLKGNSVITSDALNNVLEAIFLGTKEHFFLYIQHKLLTF